MKDTDGKKRRERPDGEALEACPDSPMASYTPEQRRAVLKGMRILARVAIRAYMEEQAARFDAETNGGEEQG